MERHDKANSRSPQFCKDAQNIRLHTLLTSYARQILVIGQYTELLWRAQETSPFRFFAMSSRDLFLSSNSSFTKLFPHTHTVCVSLIPIRVTSPPHSKLFRLNATFLYFQIIYLPKKSVTELKSYSIKQMGDKKQRNRKDVKERGRGLNLTL